MRPYVAPVHSRIALTGSIVTLDRSRLAGAIALSNAAGWNHTEQDWLRLTTLEPEGCFGLECDRTIAATTTVACYEGALAWIGMVVTDPAYRGRGFARRLMERALEYTESRGIAWIKLDATDIGTHSMRSWVSQTNP